MKENKSYLEFLPEKPPNLSLNCVSADSDSFLDLVWSGSLGTCCCLGEPEPLLIDPLPDEPLEDCLLERKFVIKS